MADSMLYLGAADVRALQITPAQAREAVLSAFRQHAQGRNQSLPKSALTVAPGHAFQAMVAADATAGIATVKWVASAPTQVGSATAGTNGLICVSDYRTGVPLSIMDGNTLTLLRTAAMSAAAAALMAPGAPSTIGLIGCGAQAFAHLEAFFALYPSLTHVRAFSRTRSSAEKLIQHAQRLGLDGRACDTPDAVLSASDVVVSMVPAAAGLTATLDARCLKPEVFVAAVDLGRSWIPASFDAFQHRVTDTLSQMTSPYAADGSAVEGATFSTDLIRLAATSPSPMKGRKLFCFRGFAIADLALAHLALSLAQERQDVGTLLPR
jgi:ornithine cyclodeaminase/alanine dehydrogenase-like protein (mu-crystallin family)